MVDSSDDVLIYCISNMQHVVSSFKGLVVDLEDGNLVKLAEDGTVLRYALSCMRRHISSSVTLSKLSVLILIFKVC